MNYWQQAALALTPILLMMAAPACALADGTVNVTLEDGSDGGNVSGMKMIATPASVKAGRITIHATNKSLGLVHEVIVVRPPTDGAPLPYDANDGRVVEKQIKDLGEVPDLPPGKSGSLTIRLVPGDYLLICNQPNHYKAGMWTKLTVTQWGNVVLRGRSGAIAAHEPMTAEQFADPLTIDYHAAFAKAEACDATALAAFAALLGRNSGDGLVSFHLKRLLSGASGVTVTV